MTPDEFRDARLSLGLSTGGFSCALNIETRTVQRYEDGSRSVPGSVERLVAILMESQEARRLAGIKTQRHRAAG